MECHYLRRGEFAEKYLNGRLAPVARDEFEVHLLQCADCLRVVDALQILGHELAEAAPRIRAYPPPIKP